MLRTVGSGTAAGEISDFTFASELKLTLSEETLVHNLTFRDH